MNIRSLQKPGNSQLLNELQCIARQENANELLWRFANEQLEKGYGRVINVDGSPYLTRIFLESGKPEYGIFLHYFHKDDPTGDLHSHPWHSAVSIVLTGGYTEERCEIASPETALVSLANVERVHHQPGDINFLTKNTYHRVELPNGGAWTLFMRNRRIQGWNFINRETGAITVMDADDSTQD